MIRNGILRSYLLEKKRSYGRRSHHVPPSLPSPQEDPRSRRSRTKMKCLISIGLILPALAAVIGVAAWAVSADVVMNSGNNRGSGRVDNNVLQNFAVDNDNRPDIFRMNSDSRRFPPRSPASSASASTTTTSTTTTTTTPPPTTSPVPQTLSPKEATDVNAILSKLISASGAASGGSGPRFVVVAPLPDNSDPLAGHSSQSGIARVDHSSSAKERTKEDGRAGAKNYDMVASESQNPIVVLHPPQMRSANFSNRMSSKEANRRMSEKSQMMNLPNSHRSGFNSQPIELTGFEPFDSMMQQNEPLMGSSSMQQVPHDPPPGFAVGSFKRGPPQGHFGSRNPLQPQHFDPKDQHVFNPHVADHNIHSFKPNHRPGLITPGVGLKPIQKQLHHVDSSAPLQTAESSRWGSIGFPHGGSYVHKPPEGISLSISSPANGATHVAAAEPVSVIKSFFLPFLPKPRLNMNARVVFGVVLDKGMGLGGKKETHHLG